MATSSPLHVLQLVNKHIDATAHEKLTVADNLDAAQCAAMSARTGPDDLDGRDAEYYLKARAMIAREPSLFTKIPCMYGGIGLSLVYSASKGLFRAVGLERYARTDPDVPTTPPGGTTWVTRGARDGLRDDGGRVGIPRHAEPTVLLIGHG